MARGNSLLRISIASTIDGFDKSWLIIIIDPPCSNVGCIFKIFNSLNQGVGIAVYIKKHISIHFFSYTFCLCRKNIRGYSAFDCHFGNQRSVCNRCAVIDKANNIAGGKLRDICCPAVRKTRCLAAFDRGLVNTSLTRPSSTTVPLSKMATLLHIFSTTLIWWVITMTVIPSFCLFLR